jgi:aflatoxin B1 aldehyde reductase
MSAADGDTESTLGQIFDMFPSLGRSLHIASKASPRVGPHFSLSKQSVIDQCDTSLEKLGVDCIELFYLHSPDIKTDLSDTLDGVEELHKAGKIEEFGLSNYPAWAVVDIWHRCKARGMVLPTVYQGRYNALSRDLEREIVPVAREFGLRLHIYNPLAGGLLSGRYSCLEDVLSARNGRFSEEFDSAFGSDSKAGTVTYRSRYAKAGVFDGLDIMRKACAPAGGDAEMAEPTLVEDTTSVVDGRQVRLIVTESAEKRQTGLDMGNIALRWLIHHSCLARGDSIILGVSKNTHLVANLAAWQGGPLDAPLVEACEAAWQVARSACEPYFDGYGEAPGSSDAFLKLKAAAMHDDAREDESSAKKAKK